MVKCHFCGGEIVKGKKNFSVARGDYSIEISLHSYSSRHGWPSVIMF